MSRGKHRDGLLNRGIFCRLWSLGLDVCTGAENPLEVYYDDKHERNDDGLVARLDICSLLVLLHKCAPYIKSIELLLGPCVLLSRYLAHQYLSSSMPQIKYQ